MSDLLFFVAVILAQADPTSISKAPSRAVDRPKLPAERVFLYQPENEWTYSHHPSLTWFKGRYYAMWSNGRRDEDAPGQRVLYCTSENFLDWTEPVPLVDTMPGEHSERVLTAAPTPPARSRAAPRR